MNTKWNGRLWWSVLGMLVVIAVAVTTGQVRAISDNARNVTTLATKSAARGARLTALEDNYRRIDTKLEKIYDILRGFP